MLKRASRLLLALLFFAIPAFGQTTTTVTGTVKDLSGAVVTSGYVTFTLQPGATTVIAGNAAFVPSAITCGINGSGQIEDQALTGSCVIQMNTAILPAGTYYKVIFQPYGVTTALINFYAYLSSQDVTTTVPTPGTMPAYSFMDLATNQTIGGVKTWTSQPVFNAGITGSGNLGALTPGTGILNTASTFSALQTFNAGNLTANSGVFTDTQMNEISQSLLNGCNPSSIFSNGSSAYFATDAGTGCVAVPSTSTVINANGLAGYGKNESSATNLVGLYSNVRPLANNTNNWGMNPVCGDNTLGTIYTGTLCVNEIDTDISSPTTTGNGLILTGQATVSNTNLAGVVIEKGGGTYPVYYTGFYCLTGGTGSGDCLLLGPQASGNNQPSQVISFNSTNSGGTNQNCQLFVDSTGNLYDFACPIRYGETSASVGGQAGSELLWGNPTTHTLMGNYNSYGAHPLYLEEIGSCSMSSGTTCTFAMGAAFNSIKGTFVSIDAASAPPATAIAAKCSASGTTATITAGASNSLTWDCLVKGQ